MFRTIKDTSFIVFDTETTGLDPSGDRLVEIGALKIIDGKITDQYFETFINPGMSIPFMASNINKITDDMVADAPSDTEVWKDFKEFIGEDSVLIAHNAEFDMGFIRALCDREGLTQGDVPECICTLKMSRTIFKGEKGHTLKKCAERMGVEYDTEKAHRALYDVQVTAQVFQKMVDHANLQMLMDVLY